MSANSLNSAHTAPITASIQAPAKATAQNARPSPDYAAKLAETQALLQTAATTFAPLTQASSLGAEDVVITHLIDQLQLDIPVFVLDTGALHTETLALLERTQAQAGVPITVYRPVHESVIEFVRTQGQDAMFRSMALRKACCGIRKMEPLARALKGQKAWITGLRQEQSNARAEVPLRDDSEVGPGSDTATSSPTTGPTTGLYKFNPLARWTWGDVWHFIAEHQVDYNPLHDRFFPSIGCAPCTRAISLGEPFRAGRWWWEDETAKECGLHVKA
jgi:phosphoadenosine phosphosulfate reductase